MGSSMVHIHVSKGLDIPIKGKPTGEAKPLAPTAGTAALEIALDLSRFEDLKFTLLVKVGDAVKIGQPLAEDKACQGRFFVSPAGGVVKEIRRGHKRVLLAIVIAVAAREESLLFPPADLGTMTREALIERLKEGGLFAHIHSRPFNRLADPTKTPRSIFVKALESAPFAPPAELQVAGHEKDFQTGLEALAKLTTGPVHLVYHKDSQARAFIEAKNVQRHTAMGPHPVANQSLHIQRIDPIRSADVAIWTVGVPDVIAIGHLLNRGRYWTERVIALAGPGVRQERVGYFKVRSGASIQSLVEGRIEKGPQRLISGDPLTGTQVTEEDFLGFGDLVFCVFPENEKREFLHFFRLGRHKYSFSRAYLSGYFQKSKYDFTTSMHGEHRAFVDSSLYDKVMPLDIPTMPLVKAVLAEDYERADFLGLLEVDSEDFALPTFVCPSKMEMVDIIKKGLQVYAKEQVS